LEFSIKSGSPEKQRSACVVVGIFEPRKLVGAAEILDNAADQFLSDILRRGDMEGKAGTSLLLHGVSGIEADRVLLVGLGKEREFREKEYRAALATAVRQLNETGGFDGTVYLTELAVKKRDVAWKIRQAALVVQETLYRFDRLKSKKEEVRRPLRKLTFCVAAAMNFPLRKPALLPKGWRSHPEWNWRRTWAICREISARRPIWPTRQSSSRNRTVSASTSSTAPTWKSSGMNTLLSVARGSHEPPKFIVLRHAGGASSANRWYLVGKGITFDSGRHLAQTGSGNGRNEVRHVRCRQRAGNTQGGRPAETAAQRHRRDSIHGKHAGRAATKPGDVITSMSGQTVEILNTDAEGRLILCDALTYVQRFDPECVVDVATLTGACVIALGHVATGLLANNEGLAKELLDAGQDSYDRAWQMPLWDDYQEQLKSNFADMANIGGRPAGTITAACFLAASRKSTTGRISTLPAPPGAPARRKGPPDAPCPCSLIS
jgi:leucyl aminopeptidase